MAAEVEIPEGGAEGVLVCCGGESAGYTLFMKDGKLHWEHNWFDDARYRVSSTEAIPPGHHMLSAEIKVDKEGKFGTGGKVTLRMGEKVIGKGRFEKQVPFRFTVNETFDVGCDTVSPVSDQYESPFAFTGKIKRVLVDVSDAEFKDLVALAKVAMATQLAILRDSRKHHIGRNHLDDRVVRGQCIMALKEYKPGTTFPGVIGRTFDDRRRPGRSRSAPRKAPRTCSSSCRRHRASASSAATAARSRTPNLDALAKDGLRLHQHAHDGALLAVALVHPDRTQPPLERDVVHHRGVDRLSRLATATFRSRTASSRRSCSSRATTPLRR